MMLYKSNINAIKKEITVSANKETYINLYLNAETFPDGLKHESLKWELYKGNELVNNGNFLNILEGDTLTILYIESEGIQTITGLK